MIFPFGVQFHAENCGHRVAIYRRSAELLDHAFADNSLTKNTENSADKRVNCSRHPRIFPSCEGKRRAEPTGLEPVAICLYTREN